MPLQPFDIRTVIYSVNEFTNADTAGTNKLIMSGPVSDYLIHTWMLLNTDTIDHLVQFQPGGGLGTNFMVQVKVPAGAGVDGTAMVDVLAILADSNNHFARFGSGDGIYGNCQETVTAAKRVGIWIAGGGF